MFVIFFFFFSSRRRHTRFDCDWSSDVCSSDLTTTAQLKQDPRTSASQADLHAQFDFLLAANRKLTEIHEQIERIREVRKQLRSEERRVGKECRSRGSPYD